MVTRSESSEGKPTNRRKAITAAATGLPGSAPDFGFAAIIPGDEVTLTIVVLHSFNIST